MPHQAVSVLDGSTFVVSRPPRRHRRPARGSRRTASSPRTRASCRAGSCTVQGQPTDVLSDRAGRLLRRAVLPRLARREAFHAAPPLGHRAPAPARRRLARGRGRRQPPRRARRRRGRPRGRHRLRRPLRGQGRPHPRARRSSPSAATASSSCATATATSCARRAITVSEPATIDGRRAAPRPAARRRARSAAISFVDHAALRPARPRARRRAGAPARSTSCAASACGELERLGGRRRRRSRPTTTRCATSTQRSLIDLAALRFYPHIGVQDVSLPAAGLPWFMTLFGRDSLITSYQALPYRPELAAHHADDAGRPPGHRAATTSATRSPARSCTSCASAS